MRKYLLSRQMMSAISFSVDAEGTVIAMALSDQGQAAFVRIPQRRTAYA